MDNDIYLYYKGEYQYNPDERDIVGGYDRMSPLDQLDELLEEVDRTALVVGGGAQSRFRAGPRGASTVDDKLLELFNVRGSSDISEFIE